MAKDKDKRLWYLSPYEFVSEWEVKLLSYPQTLEDTINQKHHADLTETGLAKVMNREPRQPPPELYPGIDYTVKDGGDDWLAYPDLPTTASLRHTWIIQKRRRPNVPTFLGSPVPSKRNDASEHSAQMHLSIQLC